ncbi:SDR family NAD(P)-dependent oxidoreductase [Duncaniella dubosii]|uniref:SDR family NAD(P)-dependent oxidoreductase n=2 Tax=Duncaniella TaxID=2518495 RepID=UPI0025B5BA88|nr:SDR family NAD(P)-dependent oxidoreductase [uncultured Duncaniella sp.]
MNILIIGATSGIGNNLWRHYCSTGNMVSVVGRRHDELDKMVNIAPDNTMSFQCDISDLDSFNTAFCSIINKMKTIDIAVVCAGIGELNPKLDIKTEINTLKVNVNGWTNCVNTIYNQFMSQGKGHLVTITSIGGLQPTPIAPAYSASKAFQINYTKSLQKKSKGIGVMVTEIRPGLIDTRMAKGEGLFWVMPLADATAAVIKAIDKEKKRTIINNRWRIINFLLRHFT